MIQNPKIVNEISQVVSFKLGREAIVRKVKNLDQYFVLDLAFSYFQKADRNRRNDYRSGYLFLKDKDDSNCLLFMVAHSPIMFSFLRNNFDYASFRQLVIDTAKFRNNTFLEFKIDGQKQLIVEENLDKFLETIDKIEKRGFANTVFSKINSSDKGIGNIFSFGIARGFKENDVDEIINLTWDLFLWLYPSKPLFNRDASLNRNLQKLVRQCEIKAIKNLPKNILTTPCNGQIEGAHIKPHKLGGSDKLENGLWLCNKHHRMTEGKISGQRSLTKIEVTYEK